MTDKKAELTQNMICATTEFGIFLVQEMATQALAQKPDMSLKEFTQVVDHQMLSLKDRIIAGK